MTKVVPNFTASDEAIIRALAPDLGAFRAELSTLFPEREWLTTQIVLAILMGQHVLVYGQPGTAKSLMARTVFQNIVGPGVNGELPRTFNIQLDSETQKADLIGPPDMDALQNHNKLKPAIQGYIPDAHWAYLDELLDAPHLLRSMNDLLAERELQEGGLNIRVPLMTAIATTNRTPDKLVGMFPELDLSAVNDRFMFVGHVVYLLSDDSIDKMLDNALMGANMTAQLRFKDIQTLVEVLKRTNQFPDATYRAVYRSVIQNYRSLLKAKLGRDLTDRRIVWATQVVEATAVMQGRANLYLEDILGAGYALAPAEDSPEYKLFRQAADPILAQAKKASSQHVDDAVVMQLDQIEDVITKMTKVLARKSNPFPQTPEEVGPFFNEIKKREAMLASIKPELDINEQRRLKLLNRLATCRTEAVARV